MATFEPMFKSPVEKVYTELLQWSEPMIANFLEPQKNDILPEERFLSGLFSWYLWHVCHFGLLE